MTVSIVADRHASFSATSNPVDLSVADGTQAAFPTPVAGDKIVVCFRSYNSRVVSSMSGLGGTYSNRYNAGNGSFWIGEGVNATGTLTIVQNSTGSAMVSIYLVRGLPAAPTVTGSSLGSTTNTNEQGPTAINAGNEQIAFHWMRDPGGTGTLTFPATETPTGWTLGPVVNAGQTGYRIPTTTQVSHRLTSTGKTNVSHWLAVVGTYSAPGATPVTVAAPLLTATLAAPAPTVNVVTSVTVAAPALDLTAAVPAPVVLGAPTVTVAAPVLTLTGSVPAPTVEVALPTVTVEAPTLSLVLDVRTPVVASNDVHPTATLTARSTLIATPVAAVLGSFSNPATIGTSPVAIDFADGINNAIAQVRGDSASVDLWFDLTSTASSELSLTWTGSFTVGLELWAAPEGETVTSFADVTLLDDASGPTLTTSVGEGQRYLVRIYPLDDANNAGTGSLAYSFADRPDGVLRLDADPIAYDVPSWLRTSILSATPEGVVEFYVDGVLVFEQAADDAGVIAAITVPVPDTPEGLHTLMALDVETGQEDAREFEVKVFTSDGSGELPESGPTTPASTEEVIRWVFETVLPSGSTTPGEVYVFPNNPSSMTTPHASRVVSADHTVAADGQPILWEGLASPTDWVIEGHCFEQTHVDALEHWHAQNRRFWAVDHLQRAWVVTFETLDLTEVRDSQHPWSHKYRAKFHIYGGPVMLS